MLRNTIFNKYVERKVTLVCPSTILFDISNIIFEPYVAQVSKYPLNISKYISYRFLLDMPCSKWSRSSYTIACPH